MPNPIKLPNGQIISVADPNYAEYARQYGDNTANSTSTAPTATTTPTTSPTTTPTTPTTPKPTQMPTTPTTPATAPNTAPALPTTAAQIASPSELIKLKEEMISRMEGGAINIRPEYLGEKINDPSQLSKLTEKDIIRTKNGIYRLNTKGRIVDTGLGAGTTTPTEQPRSEFAIPEATTTEAPDYQSFFKEQSENSQKFYADLMSQLSNKEKEFLDAYRNQPSIVDELKKIREEQGLPKLEEEVSLIDRQIIDTEQTLNKLESDISTRIKGMPVSEAARRRMLALESKPLTETLNELMTGRARLATGLTAKEQVVQQLLAATQQEREQKLKADELVLTYGKEQFDLLSKQFENQQAMGVKAFETDLQNRINASKPDIRTITFDDPTTGNSVTALYDVANQKEITRFGGSPIPETTTSGQSFIDTRGTSANITTPSTLANYNPRLEGSNNPTAFTTAIAAQAGLKEGTDYLKGKPFTDNAGNTYYTAVLKGSPEDAVNTTIKVIDKIGTQTAAGKPRWSYLNITNAQWAAMTSQQKRDTIKTMYKMEGGKTNYFFPELSSQPTTTQTSNNLTAKSVAVQLFGQTQGAKPETIKLIQAELDKGKTAKQIMAEYGFTGTADLSEKQISTLNSIVDKYNKSPLIAAADRAVILNNSIDNVKKSPGNGSAQLSLIYSYIQALDTYQSAVREGEINLTQSLLGWVGKLDVLASNITNKKLLDNKTALSIANSAKELSDVIKKAAAQKAKAFESQANTVGVGEAWKNYTSGFTSSFETTPNNNLSDDEAYKLYLQTINAK